MPLSGIEPSAPPASPSPSMLRLFALVFAGLAVVAAAPVQAEKADRFKPLHVEADLPGKLDLLHQHVVFNGNGVVTKGTMTIRANRIEVRESPDGYHTAVAGRLPPHAPRARPPAR